MAENAEPLDGAPFHPDAHRDGAGGPLAPGRAFWLRAGDGVRLRLGLWPADAGGARGTVLLFPGRTEYLEKYGATATALAAAGLATLAIDWRGQGLSDRLLDDPAIGHVARFGDYQRDVAAMVAAADSLALPRPWFLLAHSMGGAIGLRALLNGLEVRAACFTAPMWGIAMNPVLRPLAWALTAPRHLLGLGRLYAPGGGPKSYVDTATPEDNMLTTDPAMFRMLQRQIADHPALSLGGPSLTWAGEALREMHALARLPAPDLPALAMLGGRERIVDNAAARRMMARWPGGRVVEFPGAEHEILMERADLRAEAIARAVALFDGAG